MVEQQELEEVIEKLNTLEFCDDQNTVVWKLESSGKFSARSLYRFCHDGQGVPAQAPWLSRARANARLPGRNRAAANQLSES